MTHLTPISLVVLSWVCMNPLAMQFGAFDYCQYNCPRTWHVACPQPCFRNGCQYMPPSYEFRYNVLHFHNFVRDLAASGNLKQGLDSASNMIALSYDMELEFFSFCWMQKQQGGVSRCAKTQKGDLVGQTQLMVTNNTVIGTVLQAALDPWLFENTSLSPDLIGRFEPPGYGQKYENITQIIHAETKLVGCNRCRLTRGRTYITCYYWPAGNKIGSPVYQPGIPVSNCPKGKKPHHYFHNLCGETYVPADAKYIAQEDAVKLTCLNYLVCVCLIIATLTSRTYV